MTFEAIATRRLTLRQPGKNPEAVQVKLSAPHEAEDGSWTCRYEIRWPDGSRSFEAAGVDAVQALLLAMQMIGAELYTSTAHKNGQLAWNEPGSGYGFPVGKTLRDLLQGEDRETY